MDENREVASIRNADAEEISKFTDSYESFNRIINSLQRKYIELKDEFTANNDELVQANKKLVRLSERNLVATEFLNSILNSISVGVIAVDQNGRITHFNPAASMILGIPLRDPLGKMYRETIPPGNPVYANALRAAETGRRADSVEKKVELNDGTLLQLSVSTAILKDEQSRACGAVEVFQDLTKLKKMEQEIVRLNTLAALGEMAATIAHEVRNPLSGIAGFAALLEKEMAKDDPQRKLVGKIIRGVDNLNDTITSLLNYTRLEEVNKTPVDYGDYVKKIVEQYRQEHSDCSKNIQLTVHPSERQASSPIMLELDRMLLRQVFSNILNNAVEVCNGSGKIDVRYRKLPRQTAVAKYSKRLLLGVDETVVETIISDTGSGISMENLDSIFAPFFTTKQGGNGLGLAITWKIVKAHGGEVFAESSSKKGTAFHILIPTRIDTENMEC